MILQITWVTDINWGKTSRKDFFSAYLFARSLNEFL